MKKMSRKLALAVAGLMPFAATAADLVIEEITVTAERRAENLQDVSVSVTAFGEAEIRQAGIENTQDFINLTPNMNLDDSFSLGNTFVTVRGVTQINNSDSPVAVVIDGVPQNSQKQFKQELFDVERIEVLRGPQGALYGRNALGGAINIVTKQPTNEYEGSIKLGAGNGDLRGANIAYGGPIVEDSLYFRLAAGYKTFDGLIDNDTLSREADFYDAKDFRGKLLWEATENLSFDLRYSYSDLDGGGLADSVPGVGPAENADNFVDPLSNILGKSDRTVDDASLKVEWSSELGTLSYIYGYTELEENIFGDSDFEATTAIPFPVAFDPVTGAPIAFTTLSDLAQSHLLDLELNSHELRFTSADDERFRWIVGGFFQNTDRSLTSSLIATATPPGVRAPLFVIPDEQDNDAWALFAQFDYDLTDTVELSWSIRYDKDEREQTSTGLSEEFDSWQPKITLTKSFSNDSLIYATYSTGFRSGGFNIDGIVFDDETLQNFELGFKSRLLDGRMILNGAVFHSTSEDFQFFFVDFSRGGQVIDNIDEVELRGIEVEFQYLATEELRLYGSVGVTDSEITDFAQFPSQEGNHSPKSSQPSYNLGFEYSKEISNGLTGAFRVDLEHRGRKYWHPDNVETQDSLDLLNARLSLSSDEWTVAVWGKNITDEEYYTDFNDNAYSGLPTGNDIGYLGQPATYGIEFIYDF